MAEKKAKKEFNTKVYGVFAIVFVAAVLIALTVTTFVTRYNGFHAEKVAQNYVDTIVETGDGYNAYKNTLLSKDQKFGDFIRVNYLYPAIYENYTPGMKTKGLKGLNDKALQGEQTRNDDGTLLGQLIDRMYPVYAQLIEANGSWDNYDKILTAYVAALRTARAEVFGDSYFDDSVFFSCLEANVAKYGETLTGTEDAFDKNTGVQTSFASEGAYQKKFGKDYQFTVKVLSAQDSDAKAGAATGKTVMLQVLCGDTVVVDQIAIPLARYGHTWYVDQDAVDTAALYSFYR